MVNLNKRKIFLAVMVIAILLIGFAYYFVAYDAKGGLVVSYHKIVPDYIPKDITVKEKEYVKLFEDMLNDSEEQHREVDPHQISSYTKVGGRPISFEISSKNEKIRYMLRGSELYIYIYQNGDTAPSELVVYETPGEYYEKWEEYCLNH